MNAITRHHLLEPDDIYATAKDIKRATLQDIVSSLKAVYAALDCELGDIDGRVYYYDKAADDDEFTDGHIADAQDLLTQMNDALRMMQSPVSRGGR